MRDQTRRHLQLAASDGALTSPCVGCLKRAVCVRACDALEALLPAVERRTHAEMSSRLLTEGKETLRMVRGRAANDDNETDDETYEAQRDEMTLRRSRRLQRFRERLDEAMTTLGPVQQVIVRLYLEGKSFSTIARERNVSRQSVSKVFQLSVLRLTALFGAKEPVMFEVGNDNAGG